MKFSGWLGQIVVGTSLGLALVGCEQEEKKLVLKPPAVTVAEPVEQDVVDAIEFTGTTQAVATLEIRARVKGFLEKMLFEPGAQVKKDQLLFVIDPRQYQAAVDQARAELDSHKAELKFAAFEVKRLDGLSQKKVAGEYELVQAESQRDTTQATIASAEAALKNAELDLGYTQVKSPIDGKISRNLVDVGNLVGEDGKTLLATVVQDNPIHAYFNISERDYLTLRRKFGKAPPQADYHVAPAQLGLFDETGFPHAGYIDYADPAVDPKTGTLQLRAVFPNDDGLLIPGLFSRIRIPTGKHRSLLVPEVAISADQSGRFLLVVNDDDVVEYRPVKIGTRVGALRVITEGIAKTDRVIVNGIQRARPDAKVTPMRLKAESPATTRPVSTQPASS